MLVKVAIGATLGLAAYAVVGAGAFALTQRIDPKMENLVRNRYIASVLGAAGGLALAMKWPVFGAAVAAGSLAQGFGAKIVFFLDDLLGKSAPAPTSAPTKQAGLGAVFGQDMAGYEQQISGYLPMGAVFGQDMAGYEQQLGAVYGQDMAGFPAGAGAPWQQGNPFGF